MKFAVDVVKDVCEMIVVVTGEIAKSWYLVVCGGWSVLLLSAFVFSRVEYGRIGDHWGERLGSRRR